MGYKCPGCGKDFGLDREALYHHLDFESGEWLSYEAALQDGIKKTLELLNNKLKEIDLKDEK